VADPLGVTGSVPDVVGLALSLSEAMSASAGFTMNSVVSQSLRRRSPQQHRHRQSPRHPHRKAKSSAASSAPPLSKPFFKVEEILTSHDVWVTPHEGSAGAGGAAGGADGELIENPEGCLADSAWADWLKTWDQGDGIRPSYNPQGDTWADFLPTAFVTIGDGQNDPADADPNQRNRVVDARGAVSKPIGGQLPWRRTGTLPITVIAENYGLISVQVRVNCTRLATGALLKWQLDTHNRLRAAYFEMLRAHQDERSARAVQAGVVIEGLSPLENARIVGAELKRSVIELLLGRRFSGVSAVTRDAAAGYRRLSGRCLLAPSGDWDSGNSAFAISHGSPGTPPHTPGHGCRFPGMLFSPVTFSGPGQPSDPETSPLNPCPLRGWTAPGNLEA
jgi:hypothetical protein